jgi:hypothetical protein
VLTPNQLISTLATLPTLSQSVAVFRVIQKMNAQSQLAPTQILGEAAYSLSSIEALKVPSARDPDNYNLVVFPDRLLANSFLRVYDDSGTIKAQLP